MLEDHVNLRLKQGTARDTVNKELRHVKVALRWAVRRELIPSAPDFSNVFIRVDAKPPTTIPEKDFVAIVTALQSPDLVLEHCPKNWWRTFFYLAYYLGLRRGELIGLTWERVNFEEQEITVAAETSKGRKYRVLPLSPELIEILRQWKQEQNAPTAKSEVMPWLHDTYRSLYDDWHAIERRRGSRKVSTTSPKTSGRPVPRS